ncbi:hypothetical protein CMEL01_09836 [Colletotrichum melonis]|uniref:Uncharacterized protein n=2 Tax=Colletotrichum acutatum species complex TaxID=2707335 RepID=A0AAI9TU74_9PEZI|nr:uncharacterized protein CTAM01_16649 [Colletotrichum tamarilloi]KAK1445593.1 hypothetical protein CMEL01_09836 [Colletotrichum melonis]KAK1471151.1 hypothetical protein CTAM01_16649 [Colletotrichum tamarilloi]
MATEVFRGRYTDESVISQYLRVIFPRQKCQISSERGRFFCTIPRKLTQVWQAIESADQIYHMTRPLLTIRPQE